VLEHRYSIMGPPTWTSETRLLGQAAPQGRKAELRPSVPAPFLGAPAASVLVQRSGHTRSGCGQFHAAVCSVCRGTCEQAHPDCGNLNFYWQTRHAEISTGPELGLHALRLLPVHAAVFSVCRGTCRHNLKNQYHPEVLHTRLTCRHQRRYHIGVLRAAAGLHRCSLMSAFKKVPPSHSA